ncbi:MAG: TIGR03936 family radical SAM-associated protein [Clostridium sp.]
MERLLIKFTKNDEVKFISHLDTMRTIHRSLRRAGLPVSYSQGFNPHPSISVAAPLSLGLSSIGEYADIDFDFYVEEKEVIRILNEKLPFGMRVLSAIYIKEKKISAMAAVNGAKYTLRMKHNNISMVECKSYLNDILLQEEILKMKRSKKGPKETNVRPLILDLSVTGYNEEEVEIDAFIMAGSNGSLSIDMLTSIISDFSQDKIKGYNCLMRRNIYTKQADKWIDLLSFYK